LKSVRLKPPFDNGTIKFSFLTSIFFFLLLIQSHYRAPGSPPFILGRECSGIVIDVGSQVTGFDINDRVWVCLPVWSVQGVMSEYIIVPEQYVGHKPKNISFEGAAVLPYASVTIWHKIINGAAHLSPAVIKSRRILIHLGSSSKNDGVGLMVTQVFKSWGGRVTISTQEEEVLPMNYPRTRTRVKNTQTRVSNEDDDDLGNSASGSDNDDDDSRTVNSSENEEYSSAANLSSSVQMTFLHTLKSLGAESHLIIPKDESLLPDLTQR
jgi:hypothetical protein